MKAGLREEEVLIYWKGEEAVLKIEKRKESDYKNQQYAKCPPKNPALK